MSKRSKKKPKILLTLEVPKGYETSAEFKVRYAEACVRYGREHVTVRVLEDVGIHDSDPDTGDATRTFRIPPDSGL